MVTTKITRQESCDIEYRKWPYLRHATDEQLRVRLFEIINNQRTLTEENKIGLLSPDKIGEFWMSRFSHVLEECGWRGRGIQPISDFASELKGVCDPIPDVEIRLREYTKARSVVKLSMREFNEDAFLKGRIQISLASAYDDAAKLRSVRDRELARTIFRPAPGSVLIRRKNVRIYQIPAVEKTVESPTDYYLYCVAMRYSRRLFHDFRSNSLLLVHDVDDFMNRIIEAVAAKFPDCAMRGENVRYFDPFDCGDIPDVYFMKPFSYAYQQEFRLVWIPNSPVRRLAPFFIEIGSLENCAELIVLDTVADFKSETEE